MPERARYNGSMMDAKQLQPGAPFTALHDTCVIFITEEDLLGVHLPICHIERVIEETGKRFPDGSHIIYVDSELAGDTTPLVKLMHDLARGEFMANLKTIKNLMKSTGQTVDKVMESMGIDPAARQKYLAFIS